ncbi:MAG TPA: radical SAM protein [Bacillota bacterium]|nr:radical SAM protein [Bacillota bacterium]
MNDADLTKYMNDSVKLLIRDIIKNTFNDPKETAFLVKCRKQARKSMKLRTEQEKKGHHIPPFLIASITKECNLTCVGCYARENGICRGDQPPDLMTPREWAGLFDQAGACGIQFILLAGGEPLLRKEVLEQASKFPDMVFPVFTNGTLIDDEYIKFFDLYRNMVPVLSIEGGEETTDIRRGRGTYRVLNEKMKLLKDSRLLYGTSITVTQTNLDEVTGEDFVAKLEDNGCRIVFYVEYVPIDSSTREIALSNQERDRLAGNLLKLKREHPSIFFFAFPGDEQAMGGCLAAGRGFFHISPTGNAEACPFAPYSDMDLRHNTLIEVLQSEFFSKLKTENLVGAEHIGGCTLFEERDNVEKILKEITRC